MTTAKRTFFKILGTNQMIAAGNLVAAYNETIVLSAINKCVIKSVNCFGSMTDDPTSAAVNFELVGTALLPTNVGAPDKELVPRINANLMFGNTTMLECNLEIPANYGINIAVIGTLYGVRATDSNFSGFILINYEESLFS
jgi:hypothetical protein